MHRFFLACLALALLAPGTAFTQAPEDFEPWAERLYAKEISTRIKAVEAISSQQPVDRLTVPFLYCKLLDQDDYDGSLKQAVISALRRVGPEAKPAFADLLTWYRSVGPNDNDTTFDVLCSLCEGSPLPESALHAMKYSSVDYILPAVRSVLSELDPEAVAVVSRLAAGLKHPRWKIRAIAARSLQQLGPRGLAAVPRLIAALDDEEAEVRIAAIRALGSMGPYSGFGDYSRRTPDSAVADLTTKLDDADATVQFEAAVVLHREAQPPAKVIEVLMDALQHSPRLEPRACAALARVAPARNDVIELFSQRVQRQDESIGYDALQGLATIGPAAHKAIPAIRKAGWRKHLIVQTLGSVGRNDREVVTELIKELDNQDADETERENIRSAAAQSLGLVGAKDARVVPALAKAARAKESSFAWWAVGALIRISGPDSGVVPALTAVAQDSSLPVEQRCTSIAALCHIARGTPPLGSPYPKDVSVDVSAVATLATLLDDPKHEIRGAAANAIEAVGPAGAASVPRLIDLLREEDRTVRDAVVLALGAIGPKAQDAVPGLMGLLGSRQRYWHESPARALGSIGAAAVPALLERLRQREKKAEWDAEEALIEMGPSVRGLAVPTLLELLRDKTLDPAPALRVLPAMKPNPQEAVPVVSALLQRSDANLRPTVLTTLARLGPAAAPVIADELNRDQSHVFWALGMMGRDGKAAAPELRRLLKTPLNESYLRFEVAPVLAIVDPERVAELLPVATEMLDFPSARFQREGMFVLGRIHKDAPTEETGKRIRMGLRSETLVVPALEALGEMGPKARPWLADIAPLLGHESYLVRDHAAQTINKIIPPVTERR